MIVPLNNKQPTMTYIYTYSTDLMKSQNTSIANGEHRRPDFLVLTQVKDLKHITKQNKGNKNSNNFRFYLSKVHIWSQRHAINIVQCLQDYCAKQWHSGSTSLTLQRNAQEVTSTHIQACIQIHIQVLYNVSKVDIFELHNITIT